VFVDLQNGANLPQQVRYNHSKSTSRALRFYRITSFRLQSAHR